VKISKWLNKNWTKIKTMKHQLDESLNFTHLK